jgi:nicotinate-nucleotide adenylyltransferase
MTKLRPALRIGIFGGTFNPIHIGHMAIAQLAKTKCQLDKVIFVPTCLPPHKRIPRLAPAIDRYHMVKLAIADNPDFDISDFEIKKGGKSYTIDTVRHFQESCAEGTKFYFIVGEDNLAQLGSWKNIDEILKIVNFLVVNRPGFEDSLTPVKHQLVAIPGMEISSSYLRKTSAQGKSIKYLVPDKVLEYIEKHRLYQY